MSRFILLAFCCSGLLTSHHATAQITASDLYGTWELVIDDPSLEGLIGLQIYFGDTSYSVRFENSRVATGVWSVKDSVITLMEYKGNGTYREHPVRILKFGPGEFIIEDKDINGNMVRYTYRLKTD